MTKVGQGGKNWNFHELLVEIQSCKAWAALLKLNMCTLAMGLSNSAPREKGKLTSEERLLPECSWPLHSLQ
jgi:hypothetical protein